jgi:hypothetical protein
MTKPFSHIATKPLFLLLLPLFFCLHGYLENRSVQPLQASAEVFLMYAGVSLVLAGLFYLLFRSRNKAALAAFAFLSFNFFFGSVHDWLKQHAGGSFLSKYIFLLPFACLLLFVWVIYLKKSKHLFTKLVRYFNFLFLLLMLIDLIQLWSAPKEDPHLAVDRKVHIQTADTTIAKPDIYLILVDEYAGSQELKEVLGYNNSAFEEALRSRGFLVLDSTLSNYNWTIYSMASMLNMSYLLNMQTQVISNQTMYDCADLIEQNEVQKVLDKLGYRFYNHSIFDIAGQPKVGETTLLPSKKSLLTAQTFIRRFQKDLGFHFASRGRIENILKETLHLNEKALDQTSQTARQHTSQAKFVYTHLLMPHHPYYFDSTGKPTPEAYWQDEFKLDQAAYVSYLKFVNRELLQLIDSIKKESRQPPVILLMSDHGFRQFKEPVQPDYHFMNLNAVLIPSGAQSHFYNGMSNVNQFRILLNHLFQQQLPLLPDSSIFLEEETIQH